MIRNGILEISYSPYVNQITLVQRKGKTLHICVDARELDKYMVPDKLKVHLIQEILQWFYFCNWHCYRNLVWNGNISFWRTSVSVYTTAIRVSNCFSRLFTSTTEVMMDEVWRICAPVWWWPYNIGRTFKSPGLCFKQINYSCVFDQSWKMQFCGREIKFLFQVLSEREFEPDPQRI